MTLALLAPLAAQQAAQPAPPWTKGEITKVFDVRNRDVNDLSGLLNGFGATLKASPALKAIAVTGPPSVVDAMVLRCREGGRTTSANGFFGQDPAKSYNIMVDPVTVSDDGKIRTIGTNSLQLQSPSANLALRTGISVREGQKIVVGKTGMSGPDALILVVTAKVVD